MNQDPYDTRRTEQKPKRKRRSRRNKNTVVSIVGMLAALLFIFGGLTVLRVGKQMISQYVRYKGFDVPLYQNIEKADYREEAFSKDKNGLLHYDDGEIEGIPGIDVSSHQGKIDWRTAADNGVEFAFIRIGYRSYRNGNLSVDERFAENYEGAKENGIPVGIYFYSQAVTEAEAEEEAAFALKLLENRILDLPIVLDWEYVEDDTARTANTGREKLTGIAMAFCKKIERAGYTAAVYMNKSLGYHEYKISEFADAGYAFWIADYGEYPEFYYSHTYWQYSRTAVLDGISEKVDLDLWFRKK